MVPFTARFKTKEWHQEPTNVSYCFIESSGLLTVRFFFPPIISWFNQGTRKEAVSIMVSTEPVAMLVTLIPVAICKRIMGLSG